MTFRPRQKDPTQLPVQLNVKIPWQFREDLAKIAEDRGVSLNTLARDAMAAGLRNELSLLARERTKQAGATS